METLSCFAFCVYMYFENHVCELNMTCLNSVSFLLLCWWVVVGNISRDSSFLSCCHRSSDLVGWEGWGENLFCKFSIRHGVGRISIVWKGSCPDAQVSHAPSPPVTDQEQNTENVTRQCVTNMLGGTYTINTYPTSHPTHPQIIHIHRNLPNCDCLVTCYHWTVT